VSVLNYKAASLLLAVLRGEITAQQANAALAPDKPKACVVGRFGVCLTHGQTKEECDAVRD